jgi:serine/threonine protein kinase
MRHEPSAEEPSSTPAGAVAALPRRSRDSFGGQRALGPYRLIRSLGRGGMAEVFLAVHRHLGQVRAVKVLLPEGSEEDRAALVLRLITEARAMARLRHPGIVEVYECDTLPGNSAFMAMEHLAGQPVSQWLRRSGGLKQHPALAAALVGAVADALAYAHEHAIVHRDIKPENLFVIPDPAGGGKFRVKILDFGIAKLLREKPLVATQIGFIVGTPFYLAPEGWQAGATIDARTDIYSLGCVFFELLAGRPPFMGDDSFQLMNAHMYQDPPNVAALSANVSDELAALVKRMLAKDPAQRPANMAEVVRALESVLGCGREQFAERLQAAPELAIEAGKIDDVPAAVRHASRSTTMVGAVVTGRSSRTKLSSRELRILVGAGLFSLLAGTAALAPSLVRSRGPAPVAATKPPPVVVPMAPAPAPALPPPPVETRLPTATEIQVAPPAPPRPRRRPRTGAEPAPSQPYQGLNRYQPVED